MQLPGFENNEFSNHVFKLDKSLYGLKQAPRAWYERLSNFLLENGFKRGKVDNTLFLKSKGEHLLLVQVYIDDIIFGATHNDLCNEFSKMMRSVDFEYKTQEGGELCSCQIFADQVIGLILQPDPGNSSRQICGK